MAYPKVAMTVPFKPRRRFSNGRLKFYAVALVVGFLFYYYILRSPSTTFYGSKADQTFAESNSTLGVSLRSTLTLSCDPSA